MNASYLGHMSAGYIINSPDALVAELCKREWDRSIDWLSHLCRLHLTVVFYFIVTHLYR